MIRFSRKQNSEIDLGVGGNETKLKLYSAPPLLLWQWGEDWEKG